jgi:nitrate reductase NapE component
VLLTMVLTVLFVGASSFLVWLAIGADEKGDRQ